ncbi:MAG: alpha/beta hydrolase [Chloroflexi bacterium]|nr:alpha/beta hydrolase [Chloroflexota bacterium]
MAFGIRTGRQRAIDALNAASEVVETAVGPVEYALRGDAPYVVIFHGTPQSHHASFIGEPMEAAGFGTITPSRPGFLRTPLETGPSFEEQADAVAALLDALEVGQVAGYAISGGGPSGIQFAARHPDRVRALILEVAITQRYEPEVSDLMVKVSMSSFVQWLSSVIMKRFPRVGVAQFLAMESTLEAMDRARVVDDILADPEKMAVLENLIVQSPPMDLLRAGFDNDLKRFREIDQLPLDQVRCPTLLAYGTHDGDVPFSHAENAAQGIPNAELFAVENGWHLLALSDGDGAYLEAEIDFLREHLVR